MSGKPAGASRTAVWYQAARPRTLTASVVPVLVGSSVAVWNGGFDRRAFFLALVAAVAIQTAANFANDASDAARGADPAERVGPRRMVAAGLITPRQMWTATWLAVAVGAGCAVALTILAGPIVLAIGVASVVAMLGYVGGPIPYGYRGWGEVFVFLFFGLVATVGSQYVHDQNIEPQTWFLAIPVGMLATAILVANNLRDLDTDAQARKKTLAVIIGPAKTRLLYGLLVLGALAAVVILATFSLISPWTVIAAATTPLALSLVRAANRAVDASDLVPVLGRTSLLHLLVGLVLAAGTVYGPIS
ncbi:MAG: 1,4-dihydroxy-2-naphthoate polyprenyltransferase [Actinomycetota bacterium]